MAKDSLEKLIKKLRRVLAIKPIKLTIRPNLINTEYSKSEKLTILKYKKALSYVMKRTHDLDIATMVVANADCIEKGGDFLYKTFDLDNAIKQVRKYNG